MAGARAIRRLMEGQVLARLDWRDLPDLDDLALEVLASPDEADGLWWEWEDDYPTRISGGDHPTANAGEARVGWFRTSPCWCGEHGWHLDALGDDRPQTPAGRGAFMGVEW